MILWLTLIFILACSYFWSKWFFVGIFLWMLAWGIKWYRYNGRPWRKVHYKALAIWAGCLAKHNVLVYKTDGSPEFNENFDARGALESLIKNLVAIKLYECKDPKYIVEREFSRVTSFYDKPHLIEYLVKTKKHSLVDACSLVDLISEELNIKNNSLMVSMIIASVIEAKYSLADRSEYLIEVFGGRAN